MADLRPSPSLAWRLPVATGITTMAVLTVSDGAWSAWAERVGPRPPRAVITGVLGATVAVHVVEAAVAGRRARAAGLEHPARWAAATLAYGFPVLGRLSRATAARA